MDVVLLERVAKLGQMGEVVKVKDGYGRNFLLPQGKALRATAANLKRFETERAGGNMKTGIFTGDAPVRVTGPMGTIEAAGFRIEKSVKQVTFTGGVTSVFDPAAAKAADPGSKDKTP